MKLLREELIRYCKSLGVKDDHAAETIVHDALLANKPNLEYKGVKFKTLDYFEREFTYNKRDVRLHDIIQTNEGTNELISNIPYDDFNEKAAALLDSQRQLIGQLLDRADDHTKMIVETWLSLDKPSVYQVGMTAKVTHRQVKKALKQLNAIFNNNDFGDKSEYL